MPKTVQAHVATTDAFPAPDASSLADGDWVRLVPVYYADPESLATRRVEGATPSDPPRVERTLDRKVTRGDDVRDATPGVHVSEALVDTLRALGGVGLAASPVPHGSPNAVRGVGLYALEPAGWVARVADATAMASPPNAKPRPYGRQGLPVPPLVLDGAGWEGSPVAFTEWCGSERGLPWRGLVVRGDLVRAFERMHGRRLRCGWEPVRIENLPHEPASRAAPLALTPCPPQWTATPTEAELVARIEAGGLRFDHLLPAAPDPTEAARVLDETASRVGGAWSPAVRALLTRWNGASLFGGALGFFALTAREGAGELTGRHAHFGVPDGIAGAQARVAPEEWGLTPGEGWLLFGWRAGDPQAIWALTPGGAVHLLAPGGGVLGPGLPVEEWLHDQLEDLEYAATSGAQPAARWLGE